MKVKYTRSQILDARKKWAEFLMKAGRKKAINLLDTGDGNRCCLGHGAYLFKLPKVMDSLGNFCYGDEIEMSEAPKELIDILGLWDQIGSTDSGETIKIFKNEKYWYWNLAELNDNTPASPQRIGKYIMTVLEGGRDTPFRPLYEYPE